MRSLALPILLAMLMLGCGSSKDMTRDASTSGAAYLFTYSEIAPNYDIFNANVFFRTDTEVHIVDLYRNGTHRNRFVFGDNVGECFVAKPGEQVAGKVDNCYYVFQLRDMLELKSGVTLQADSSHSLISELATWGQEMRGELRPLTPRPPQQLIQ